MAHGHDVATADLPSLGSALAVAAHALGLGLGLALWRNFPAQLDLLVLVLVALVSTWST